MRKALSKMILSALLALAMLVGLTACGTSSSTTKASISPSGSTNITSSNTIEDAAKTTAGTSVKKVVTIAYAAEPESFDPVMGTSVATRTITKNVYEGLLEMDGKYNVQCQLCESYDISEDGTTYTFHLRKGVKFHNGKEMTADDVVASLNYWASFLGSSDYFSTGEKFVKTDDYTVTITFPVPRFMFKYYLCNQTGFAAIMPKEAVTSAGKSGVTQFIGTGPYKWDEYKPSQYVKLEKFSDYKGPSYESNGGDAGNRICTIPVVYYDFVTDATTRLSGVIAGQYDIATDISFDNLDQINANNNLKSYQDWCFSTFIFMNQKKGVFQDKNLRKAVRLAADAYEMAAASIPNKNYYKITGSFDSDIFSAWYVKSADQYVNNKDIETAKKLVKDSSYDGSPLKLATTDAYPVLKAMTMVLQQELKAIGINCDVQSYDWSTMLSTIWTFNPAGNDNFDLYIMAYPYVPAPISSSILTSTYSIGYADLSVIADSMNQIQKASDPKDVYSNWESIQKSLYDNEMLIKVLDQASVTISTKKVANLSNFDGPLLWGATVTD